MITIYLILFFVFGIIIGSFLNVVIFRLNSGKKISEGRSMCMSCGKTLEWHELVPVFSYLIQKGKCTKCKSKISAQYPVVELSTGIISILVATNFISDLSITSLFSYLFFFAISSILLVIAVYDIHHKIIPDKLVYSFIALAIINIIFIHGGAWQFGLPSTLDLLAGLIIPIPFIILFILSSGRAMGFGDIKLMAGMGFLFGFKLGLIALIISFWVGAIASVFLLLVNRKYNFKSQIPFGPFLILATFLCLFFSNFITSLHLFNF